MHILHIIASALNLRARLAASNSTPPSAGFVITAAAVAERAPAAAAAGGLVVLGAVVLVLAPPNVAAIVAAHRPHSRVVVAGFGAAFAAPPPRPSVRRHLPSRCHRRRTLGSRSSTTTAGSPGGGGGGGNRRPLLPQLQLRRGLSPRIRSLPPPTVTLRATATTGGIPWKEEVEDRDDLSSRREPGDGESAREPEAEWEAGGENSAAAAPLRFPGKHKWLGGAVDVDGDGDGSIYGIPSHAGSVLRITPLGGKGGGGNIDANSVNIGGGGAGVGKEGGVFDGSDRVPPVHISTIPLPSTLMKGRFKWLRGIVAGGHLYGISSWCRHGVLKLRLSSLGSGGGSHIDGDAVEILLLPSLSAEAKRGKPTAGDGGLSAVDAGRWLWHGAALTSDHSAIYCIPANAERVLKICLRTHTTSHIGPRLFPGLKNKWYGGIRGADGAVYGMPYAACGVLRIDPRTDGVSIVGDFGTGEYNWHGGVFVPANGCIYAFHSHSDRVLKIDTNAAATPPPLDAAERWGGCRQTVAPGHPTRSGRRHVDNTVQVAGRVHRCRRVRVRDAERRHGRAQDRSPHRRGDDVRR